MANDLGDILDVERSALLVIDVQNDYIHEDGALSKMGKDTAPIRAIVPNVCELIDLASGASTSCGSSCARRTPTGSTRRAG